MMMPANFTAVNSEVVYGGADLFSILADTTAPIWGPANVKTFNTNLLTIIGNSFVTDVIGGTVGVVFGGDYMTKYKDAEGKEKRVTVLGKNKGLWNALDPNGDKETTGLNKFLQGVGALAAVYQLGTSTAKAAVAESKPIGITGALSF